MIMKTVKFEIAIGYDGKRIPSISMKDDIGKIINETSQMIKYRYSKQPRTDFEEKKHENDLKSRCIGFIGELCFQALLNRCNIFYQRDEPMFYWQIDKLPSDFLIFNQKTEKIDRIEIKTNPDMLKIKKKLWRNNADYVVALKYLKDFAVQPIGYIEGINIKDLPVDHKEICPYAPCYYSRYENRKFIHDLHELKTLMLQWSVHPERDDKLLRSLFAIE